MNAATRKTLRAIIDNARAAIENVVTEYAQGLRELGEEEQGKFDNLTEGRQASEAGQKLEEWANALAAAADAGDELQDAIDSFDGALTELEGLM